MADAQIGFEAVALDVKSGGASGALPGYVNTPDAVESTAAGMAEPDTSYASEGAEYTKDSETLPLSSRQASYSIPSEGGQTVFFRTGDNDEQKCRIDFVLVYQVYEDKPEEWRDKRDDKRRNFLKRLEKEGLIWEEDKQSFDQKSVFIKLHAPWTVLMREAEQLGLKMPVEENNRVHHSLWDRAVEKMNCCNLKSPMRHGLDDVQQYITLPFNKAWESKFLNVENQETFFSPAQRSLIVHEILLRTQYSKSDDHPKVGYERLIENKTFEAAFPLHSGKAVPEGNDEETDRSKLRSVWGRWGTMFKYQPLDDIRAYFGEKVAMYFCWIGFYTQWLIPVTIFGLIAFIYGLAKFNSFPPVNEVCNQKSFFMCPSCDTTCDFYFLNETCYYARAAYLFDNELTVAFAAVMCIWAVFFLEFWKRKEKSMAFRWDVHDFEDLEERPRAAFEANATRKKLNPVNEKYEGYVSPKSKYGKILNGLLGVALLIFLVIGIVVAVIIYRLSIVAVFNEHKSIRPYSSIAGTVTAATIQLILISVMNIVYQIIAKKLTDYENHRTQTEFDDHFTFKMFLFQFVNYYSSVFYIAFFKGKLVGYPGNYYQPFGARLDECGAGGCMIELTQQLAIIMVGKQVLNNFMEIVLPWLKAWWRRRDTKDDDSTDNRHVSRWEEDLDCADLNRYGLFAEYLEMVIQFGFITIFVAAFPLAPLFALLNNILEIRLDAKKFVTIFRRPVAYRAQDIGIWYSLLEGIAKLSIITNAFIVAVTSEFLPRLLYQHRINPYQNLTGFVDYTLARANVSELKNPPGDSSDYLDYNTTSNYTYNVCRYFGYRDENNELTRFYYEYLTVALAFVIVFEHVIFALVNFIAWIVPDVPSELKLRVKREAYLGKVALREKAVEEIDGGGTVAVL